MTLLELRRIVFSVLAPMMATAALFTVGVVVQADDCGPSEYCRAGRPFEVKVLAAPSNTRNYGGYYVGGGNAFLAGGPRPIDQGTWGWDYGGFFKPNLVKLGWNQGNRYQSGTGRYKTAGFSIFRSQ